MFSESIVDLKFLSNLNNEQNTNKRTTQHSVIVTAVNKFPLLPLILHSRKLGVSFIPHLHPKIYYERVYRSEIFYFQYHLAALYSQNNGWRDPLLPCQLLWESSPYSLCHMLPDHIEFLSDIKLNNIARDSFT